jgi:hypothetical protein
LRRERFDASRLAYDTTKQSDNGSVIQRATVGFLKTIENKLFSLEITQRQSC